MLQDGAIYHVTARANRQEMIMDSIRMKALFLATVMRAKQKYRFELSNFTIMGNHFHFIIKPGKGECLSSIMQWILSVFAMAYNKINGISGHVWGERFFSEILGTLKKLLSVFAYIDQNPVKAGLVSLAWEWDYGGLAHHRKGIRGIVDELEAELLASFPLHALIREA